MKDRKDKPRGPILAAGGIVLRGGRKPQFAVVRLRKLGAWVLPKGKLAADEDAITAARREVLEETGHRVTIHEFLGTLAYEASRRPKVVQFWRMQAIGEPVRDLMRDVTAVEWLSLEDAIGRLTHLREQVFLEQVGSMALKSAERSARRAAAGERSLRSLVERPPSAALAAIREPLQPSVPIAGPDRAGPNADGRAGPVLPADTITPSMAAARTEPPREQESAGIRRLAQKTWVWFRHATLTFRPRLD